METPDTAAGKRPSVVLAPRGSPFSALDGLRGTSARGALSNCSILGLPGLGGVMSGVSGDNVLRVKGARAYRRDSQIPLATWFLIRHLNFPISFAGEKW